MPEMTTIIRKWLCKAGWHKWTTREIHQTAPMDHDRRNVYFSAAIIDRCACGKARLAMGGRDKPTCIVVPMQYKEDWENARNDGQREVEGVG